MVFGEIGTIKREESVDCSDHVNSIYLCFILAWDTEQRLASDSLFLEVSIILNHAGI